MAQRPRMRPTFEIPLVGDGSNVLGHIKEHLHEDGCIFTGQVLDHLRRHRLGRAMEN